MTMPDTRNWTWRVEAGEREAIEVPILQSDGVTPKDVTGYTIDAAIKTEPGGELLYQIPAEDISVEESVVTLTIPGPVSAAWTWSVGWWRLKVTEPDPPNPLNPDAHRVVQGTFFVDQE